jgi:hypothetical protein
MDPRRDKNTSTVFILAGFRPTPIIFIYANFLHLYYAIHLHQNQFSAS